MSHDDKLKDFLKKNDQNDYSAPPSEFETIYRKATVEKSSWFKFAIPALATALVLGVLIFAPAPQGPETVSDESLEEFISAHMEYSMMDSDFDGGDHYFELIEE